MEEERICGRGEREMRDAVLRARSWLLSFFPHVTDDIFWFVLGEHTQSVQSVVLVSSGHRACVHRVGAVCEGWTQSPSADVQSQSLNVELWQRRMTAGAGTMDAEGCAVMRFVVVLPITTLRAAR